MKIAVLVTCFNRCDKTKKFIRSLTIKNPKIEFEFLIVDGGSSDGTIEMLENLKNIFSIRIIKGNDLYYSQGMRLAMQELKETKKIYDFILIANDDVELFNESIEKMCYLSEKKGGAVIVGATCDQNGNYTYGGIKYYSGIKYKNIDIHSDEKCDTFNANAVIIPFQAFTVTNIIDKVYIHSLGDFDYGFSLSKSGYSIYSSNEYVGICERNSILGGLQDSSLSRIERFRLKESPKGFPFLPWFVFLYKNFGIRCAIWHSITPYIKIILKKW